MTERKNKSINTTKLSFEKLTPIDNADISIYEDAINFAFKEEDVYNVAITGSYSSGKSSVLETYKKKHNKKFIHISLANFEDIGEQQESCKKRNIDTILEGKIINQLIHQISPDSIPKTHFKIKRDSSPEKVMTITCFIVMLIISSFLTFFPSAWLNFIDDVPDSYIKPMLASLVKTPFIYTMWLITALFVCVIVYSIVKIQFDRNVLKKIAVKGLEIEVLEDNKDSYFDKYLNEVLYIFEKAEVDGIVFEDIDRYDNNRIFTKLREISYLVNKKSNSKKLCFLYLLRDDIFINKDRTKFFDLIVPIVPVVDNSNSVDIFLKRFEEIGILKRFDSYFLEGISLYIDDMRLLKNICNEYLVYINRIKNIELNSNKLLAIMSLKNIFPKEFSQLQLGRGYLSYLFSQKDNIVSALLSSKRDELTKCDVQIEEIKKESLEDILELQMIYINYGSNEYIRHINDKNFDSRKELISYLINFPTEFKIHRMRNRGVNTYALDAEIGDGKRLIDELKNDVEYQLRRKLVESKRDKSLEKIADKKRRLQSDLQSFSHKKLHELITKENEQFLFESNVAVEHKDLLENAYFPFIVYLIRNGYIDETYPDYLSYFYEESIQRIDKIYLRSVLDHVSKPFTYELMEPSKVVERLKPGYFDNEELLNNSMLDYLLENWSGKGERLLKQVINNYNEGFFWQFFVTTKNKALLFKYLLRVNFDFLNSLVVSDKADPLDVYLLVVTMINLLDKGAIDDLNKGNSIGNFIYNNMSILYDKFVDYDRLIDVLEELEIEFETVPIDEIDEVVADGIYTRDLYELNIENIVMWISKREGYSGLSKPVNVSRLTSILFNADTERLTKYVKGRFGLYLDQLELLEVDEFSDDYDVVIDVLNSVELDDSRRIKFLNRQIIIIEKITDIEDLSIWNSILLNNNAIVSSFNIVKCFIVNEEQFTDTLVQFINGSDDVISITYSEIEEMESKEVSSAFYREFINCNGINNDRYEEVLLGFKRYYKAFTFKGIDLDKIEILLRLKIIKCTKSNLSFIREEYFEVIDLFAAYNIDEYILLIQETEIDDLEMYSVIESNMIDDIGKINFLKIIEGEIELENRNISDPVFSQILRNNLSLSDLGYCIKQWTIRNGDVKEDIEIVLSENIETLLEEEFNLHPDLVIAILQKVKPSRRQIEDLILGCLQSVNRIQAKKLFSVADEVKLASIFESKRPNIPMNDFSTAVLTYFKKKGWVTTFKKSKEKVGCYKVNTRRKWID